MVVEIGQFVKIPKGTKIFLISLQTNFILAQDEVVKITNRCMMINTDYAFGILQVLDRKSVV